MYARVESKQAVATGDLTQKIVVPVEGDVMIELKDIINSMVRGRVRRVPLVR